MDALMHATTKFITEGAAEDEDESEGDAGKSATIW
jgi:hypothetical protein